MGHVVPPSVIFSPYFIDSHSLIFIMIQRSGQSITLEGSSYDDANTFFAVKRISNS